MKKLDERHWEIKRELAASIKHQVRRIPLLQFYLDETLDQVYKMEELFKQIKQENPPLEGGGEGLKDQNADDDNQNTDL
jgi:ribosome-binding factor A